MIHNYVANDRQTFDGVLVCYLCNSDRSKSKCGSARVVRPAVDPLSMNLSDPVSYPVDRVELSEVEKARSKKRGGDLTCGRGSSI